MESSENYAIRVLEDSKLQAQERFQRELAEIDAAIARLRIEDAQKGGQHDGKSQKVRVGSGQFRGLSTSSALQGYLNLIGMPAKLDDVVRDLLIAGVDLGKADRRKRNLKIVITNNSKLFSYNEQMDAVELLSDVRSKRLPGKVG